MKKRLLLLTALFLGPIALGSSSKERVVTGILLEYRSGTSRETRMNAYRKVGMRLNYSAKNFNSDLLRFPGKLLISSSNVNLICKNYRKYGWVSRCEAYEPPHPNQENQADCSSNGRPETGNIAELSNRINRDLNACSLFSDSVQLKSGIVKAGSVLNGLTPFWAQEEIGADLAKDFMSHLSSLAEPGDVVIDELVSFEAIDQSRVSKKLLAGARTSSPNGSQGGHGTSVANLIFGPSPLGVAYNAYLMEVFDRSLAETRLLQDAVTKRDDAELKRIPEMSILEALDRIVDLEKSEKNPFLVNVSSSLGGNSKIVREALNKVSSGKAVLVVSAGNDFDAFNPADYSSGKYASTPISDGLSDGFYDQKFLGSENNRSANAIVVGSLSPFGLVSHFSNADSHVTISAPSDSYILSTDDQATLSKFGGTSGATPLVKGALDNVLSIIADLTLDEAKTLLRKTSLPTLNSKESPQRDGAGMLNAYRLVRVAERLREKGWPKNRNKLLQDASLYNFTDEATNLSLHVGKMIGDTSPSAWFSKQAASCDDKKKAFDELRQVVLLDPSNTWARKTLAAAYRAQGFASNAEFYDLLGSPGEQKQALSRLVQHPESYLIPDDLKETRLVDKKLDAFRGQVLRSVPALRREMPDWAALFSGDPELQSIARQISNSNSQ